MDTNRETPGSPCTNRCIIRRNIDVCAGCFRTSDEISEWSVMDSAERRNVLRRCEERRVAHPEPS